MTLLRSFIVMSLVVSMSPNRAAAQNSPTELRGYSGYEFGMTLAQVRKINPAATVVRPCDYVGVPTCIKYSADFFGEAGTVTVQLSEAGGVNQIVVEFNKMGGKAGACTRTFELILRNLLNAYGPKYVTAVPHKASWRFPHGGGIDADGVCIDADMGVVTVAYMPSAGL